MKHTFARKALLMGIAMLAMNNFSTIAMDQRIPTDVKAQMDAQTTVVQNLPEKEKERELNSNMKTLDRLWKPMIRCIEGKGCTGTQIAGVIAALTAVMGTIRAISGEFPGESKTRGWFGRQATAARGSAAGQFIGRQYGKLPSVFGSRSPSNPPSYGAASSKGTYSNGTYYGSLED